MKRNITTFLSIVSVLFIGGLGSCKKKNVMVVKNLDGIVVERYQITADSVQHGWYYSFYENGDTFEVSAFQNGKRNGQRRIYYENNQVEMIENYVQDTLQGKILVYYPSGNLKLEKEVKDHVLEGKIISYYESGSVKEEVTMKDNKEEGSFVEYHENGKKAWEGTYRDGENEYGLLIQFAENGDTIKKMMCDERYICRTIYQNERYRDKTNTDD